MVIQCFFSHYKALISRKMKGASMLQESTLYYCRRSKKQWASCGDKVAWVMGQLLRNTGNKAGLYTGGWYGIMCGKTSTSLSRNNHCSGHSTLKGIKVNPKDYFITVIDVYIKLDRYIFSPKVSKLICVNTAMFTYTSMQLESQRHSVFH